MAEIKIDVTDWEQEALRAEEVPQNYDDLIAMATERGLGAKKAAEYGIGVRAGGHSPDDILPEDKALLSTGGAAIVNIMVGKQKKAFEIKGKQYAMRTFTAVIREEEDPDSEEEEEAPEQRYVETGTEKGGINAIRYLERRVPGHIWNRFVEISAAGGDVRPAADELIRKIQEFVDQLTETT